MTDDPSKRMSKVICYEISHVQKEYEGLIESAELILQRAKGVEEQFKVLKKTLSEVYPELLTAFDDRGFSKDSEVHPKKLFEG